jgi:hypothetical protein
VRSWTFRVGLALLFLATMIVRFMALANGFTNDHFIHLAGARQLLLGEWPTRDFLDHGLPLMYAVSALAQLAFGETLYAEAILVTCAFGLAAVLTAAAVHELTGSRLLAIFAALLEVAILPRAYGYPKILVYAIGFLLLQRYVSRPTRGRLVGLAAAVVLAFLFRHDHGIYLAAGCTIAVSMAPDPSGGIGGPRRAAAFAAIAGLMAAPYILYVQIYGGVWAYLQKGLEFRERELSRSEYVWPDLFGDLPFQAALLYAYWALPVGAALLLFAWRRRADAAVVTARVAPVIAVALLMNSALLRPPLHARLPDAIVPGVVLAAWLIGCGWRWRPRWLWRPAAVLLGVLLSLAVLQANDTAEQLRRGGMLAPLSEWPASIERTRARLMAPYAPETLPSRAAEELVPFYNYVARCTGRDDRLLLVGVIPEVAFFAQRGFAGGQPILVGGYYESEVYQQSVLRKLSTESVPFVLIPGEAYTSDFDSSFPAVAGYVRRRYAPLATFGDEEATRVDVLIDRTAAVKSTDARTGWPCLK